MRPATTVLVTWTFTEQHQALIPADDLARALGVEPAAFSPSMLIDRQPTGDLDDLIAEHQDDNSYENCVGRDITHAQPGPPPPTMDELLRRADDLLDGEHATTGTSDAGLLLAQLVAAIRHDREHAGGAA